MKLLFLASAVLLAVLGPADGLVPSSSSSSGGNSKRMLSKLAEATTATAHGLFTIAEDPSIRGTTVLEAPVTQDGIKLYIAIDGTIQRDRPGNGGIRLLNYESDEHAIDDAVRLAKGMTRKHDMFRTGFSGAKLVCRVEHDDLDKIHRQQLMEDTAAALRALDGTVYTGCDLNTSDEDMDYLTCALDDDENLVLAGRNAKVDTNDATAMSVIGSILGVCDANGENLEDLTFTVQGCGKVGSTVAAQLVRLGAKRVQTCDLFPEAADIPGCTPVVDWTSESCDFLVPCANSLAITEEVASGFPEGVRYCVGAANSPFASEAARDIFDARGVLHVPESISSAGAILADSVEWYDVDLYRTVEPALMNGWIRDISRSKARKLSELAGHEAKNVNSVLSQVVPNKSGDPVGKDFPDWIKDNMKSADTLIVGGGMAGTAAAFSLAELGRSSILAESGPVIAPGTASSNGDSRMYRQMYSDPFFSRMQAVALDRWHDIEKKTGQKLLQENGLLFYGEDTGETVEGSVLGAKKTMEELGLEHTFYKNGDEIAAAFPALAGSVGKDYQGVRESTAGHIRATKACEAMVEGAGDKCTVKCNSKIVSLDLNHKDESGQFSVCAVTEDGETFLAKDAVIAAGPWTNSVLQSANLPKLNLEVWRVQWAHYEVDVDVAASIPQAFHFREETGIDGGLYYVFPASATECVECTDAGKTYVKVGVDFPTGGALEGMDEFSYDGCKDVLALIDGWVAEHLPQVGKRIDSYCSPYTMTSDSYFVMDKVTDNCAIFTGGSGRAFKFGPLIGDCLASLLCGTEAPVDLKRFSACRDAVKANVNEDEKGLPTEELALQQ